MTIKLMCAFALAFLFATAFGKVYIPWLKKEKARQSIREDGPTWHMNKSGTPTMGGVMFILATALICLTLGFPGMLKGNFVHIFVFLFALVFGAIGFLDDWKKEKKKQNLGLTAKMKFLLQLAAALVFVLLMRQMGYLRPNLYVPFFHATIHMPEWLYFVFASFVIVGTVNAVNITDGLDGLATGTSIPVVLFFVILTMAWGEQYLELGLFASGLLGGMMGFLVYNFNPAKVFMGDTGSLFLGGAIAALAFAYDIPLILVTLGIVYIIETLSDIIQVVYFKLSHGKRVFRMAPLHHHLEMGGWTGKKWKEREIFVLFTGISLVFAIISFIGVVFLLVLLLLVMGVVMVLSSSFPRAYYDPGKVTGGQAAYYFVRQLIFAVLGLGAMLLASRLPMDFYRRCAPIFLLLTLGLLALVPFIGVRANGARRWLGVGGLTLQPSELAKLAVILSFAALICRYREKMHTLRYGILPFLGILGLIVGLLILEPHFSASIIILAIGGVMLFLGGVGVGWFLAALGGLGGGLLVLLTFFPYASSRISTWRDPFSSSSDEGYQIVQSLVSIGSGGLSGLGLGESRQKYLYLPEEHNDFIFSVACEELGFIGAALILTLFALLILRGYWIALHCSRRFDFLVVAGITTLLALQVFLNVAVVTNLLPCTGISLPFFSYGGTALLIQLGEMGIVLSASREILEA